VSVYGGRGRITGVAVGILILAALRSGMQDLAKPTYITDLATGSLLSVFLLVELASARRPRSAGPRLRGFPGIRHRRHSTGQESPQ
jgi:ribose/xylose/arabinose/galactoside ABC-type transport system permease subunit